MRGIIQLLGFLLLVQTALRAQPHIYSFEQLPTEIGLTHSSINCLLQDHKGFLWFGTWSGLGRYDGYNVKIFRQESGNARSLQSDQITSILEDRKKRMWIGALNVGFYRFDRTTEQFTNYHFDPENPNSLSDNDVWGLFEDSKGYIWIGTKNGLNRFDPERNTFLRIYAPAETGLQRPSDYIYSICETPDGSIWSATSCGLNRIAFKDKDRYELKHYWLNPAKNANCGNSLDDFIYRIRPAKKEKNALWLGTKAGLKKIEFSDSDKNYLAIESYRSVPTDPNTLSNNVVSDVWEEDNGNLWVATFNGLNLLEKGSVHFQRFFSKPGELNGLNNNLIHFLMQDRTAILWIGTDKGINKLNLREKPFYNVQFHADSRHNNNIVTSVCRAGKEGQTWVGTSGGLYLVDVGQSRQIPHHILLNPPQLADFANFISSICTDDDGNLWIATQGAGVLRIDQKQQQLAGGRWTNVEQFSRGRLTDDYTMHLYAPSGTHRIWIGLWDGGVDLYDKNNGEIYHYQKINGLNLNTFPNVAFAETHSEGRANLWVGTRGNGLLKLNFDPVQKTLYLQQQFKFRKDQPGCLSNDKVNALFLDNAQRLWVCTSEGLNMMQPGGHTFRVFTTKDGLPDNIIQAITQDRQGGFWISTQSGIASLQWQGKDSVSIRNYDVLDGLQDNFFSNNCAVMLGSGQLAFGGVDGLSFFKPEQIEIDSVAPLTVISDFQLFNKSIEINQEGGERSILRAAISETDEIVLSYRDNVISFEFASLHFAKPQKNRFAYKLEGFNEDWVYTDAEKRFAHYTNLPYRSFVLWVKSANRDGIWSEPVALRIRIRPPFWLTHWAFTLYGLLVIAMIYGGWRVTHLRAEFRNRLALERVEREKLEEVNQLKIQFFTNISHELRTPLTLILSPLEQLIQRYPTDSYLAGSLKLMYRQAGKLLTMINQLLDFRKSEAGLMKMQVEPTNMVFFLQEVVLSFKPLAADHHIDLRFKADNEEINAWIDRGQMEKVIFNLLSNALKYTNDGGWIQLRLSELRDSQHIKISVLDSGQGIPPDHIDHIFDPFHQGVNLPVHNIFGGTGIGLALVKTIVDKHGGSITVRSEEGKGAEFEILLPERNAQFKPEDLSETNSSAFEAHFVLQDEPHEEATAPSVPEAGEKFHRPHLLIVEDNADIRAYLKSNLKEEYDITEANDGVEALEKAKEVPPHLIVSDIAMPRMDGIELCRHIKTDILTSHIPVILLTARTSPMYKIDGLETGADDYITKPFSMQLLAVRIKNLIATREKLKEKFSANFDLSPSAVTANSLDADFLQRIIDIVEQHIDESEFSIDHLAKELTMSRMQLYRKLKALTNETPNTIIRTIRLKRAAQLLATQQYNISEVAYMVGFTDLKYFRERFKEQFGVIPSAYNEA